MTTREQWYNHPSFQTDLKAILEMPVLRTALEICRNQELIPITTNRAVNLVDYVAIMGSKKEGYNEFFVNLLGLTQPKGPSVSAQKPWEYETKPEGTPTNAKS